MTGEKLAPLVPFIALLAVLVAAGCSEPILLGPEHEAVVLRFEGVLREIGSRAITVHVSFVPVHATLVGAMYRFAESPRNAVVVEVGDQAWTIELRSLAMVEGVDLQRFLVVAEDRGGLLVLDLVDSTAPFELLRSTGLPIGGVNVESAGARGGYVELPLGHRPGSRVFFSIN